MIEQVGSSCTGHALAAVINTVLSRPTGKGGRSRAAKAPHLSPYAIAEDRDDAETVIGTYLAVTFALKLAGREHDVLEEAQQGYQRALNSA